MDKHLKNLQRINIKINDYVAKFTQPNTSENKLNLNEKKQNLEFFADFFQKIHSVLSNHPQEHDECY